VKVKQIGIFLEYICS